MKYYEKALAVARENHMYNIKILLSKDGKEYYGEAENEQGIIDCSGYPRIVIADDNSVKFVVDADFKISEILRKTLSLD